MGSSQGTGFFNIFQENFTPLVMISSPNLCLTPCEVLPSRKSPISTIDHSLLVPRSLEYLPFSFSTSALDFSSKVFVFFRSGEKFGLDDYTIQ
jgi:hypothetical protein